MLLSTFVRQKTEHISNWQSLWYQRVRKPDIRGRGLIYGWQRRRSIISECANLVFVIWDLPICFNDALVNTSSSDNLVLIRDGLFMFPNTILCAIDGFHNIHSLVGDVVVVSNERPSNVTSLMFIGSVRTKTTIGHLHFQHFPILVQAKHPSVWETTTWTSRYLQGQENLWGIFARQGDQSAAIWRPFQCKRLLA